MEQLIYPWHFIPAVNAAPDKTDVLEAAMLIEASTLAPLTGKTAVLVDVSAAMDQPLHGDMSDYDIKKDSFPRAPGITASLRRIDAAVGLAVLVKELAPDCHIFSFSNHLAEISGVRGFALMNALFNSQPHMDVFLRSVIRDVCLERRYDRVIIITAETPDEDVVVPQDVKGYMIVLNPPEPGLTYGPGPWVQIDGWRDDMIDLIRVEAESHTVNIK